MPKKKTSKKKTLTWSQNRIDHISARVHAGLPISKANAAHARALFPNKKIKIDGESSKKKTSKKKGK